MLGFHLLKKIKLKGGLCNNNSIIFTPIIFLVCVKRDIPASLL